MPEHQQTQQSTESKTTSQKQATPRIQTPVSNPFSIIQRARINPKSLTPADILQLQRTIGNRAVGRLISEIRSSSTAQKAPVQRQEIPEEEEPLQGKMIETIQRQEIPEEEEPLQTKRENNTGMPDNLKTGVENLSGIDMSDVRVHYNSSKPAEVGALAYTQGTNIHVAPGQERHLPHEAWHVVQQVQGRVQPTMQLKNVAVNDDKELETEANVMGNRAQQSQASFYSKNLIVGRLNRKETRNGKVQTNLKQQSTIQLDIETKDKPVYVRDKYGNPFIAQWNEKSQKYELYTFDSNGSISTFIKDIDLSEAKHYTELGDKFSEIKEMDLRVKDELLIAGDLTLGEGVASADKFQHVVSTAYESPKKGQPQELKDAAMGETGVEVLPKHVGTLLEHLKIAKELEGLTLGLGMDVGRMPENPKLQPDDPGTSVLLMVHPFTRGQPSWPKTQESVSQIVDSCMSSADRMKIPRVVLTVKEKDSTGRESKVHKKCYRLKESALRHRMYPYRKDRSLGFQHHTTQGRETTVIPEEQSRTFHFMDFKKFIELFDDLIQAAEAIKIEPLNSRLINDFIERYREANSSERLPYSLRDLLDFSVLPTDIQKIKEVEEIKEVAMKVRQAALNGLPESDYDPAALSTDDERETGGISDIDN